MNIDRCPLCGCREIGEGRFKDRGGLVNPDSILGVAHPVAAYVCTDCGYIIAMRVLKPKKFKNK